MKIINSTLRAVVKRITQLELWPEKDKLHVWVFEYLDSKGVASKQWIQNWECEDVTQQFSETERREIYNVLEEYYKSKSNSAD